MEKQLTLRQQAVQIIEDGGSVRVGQTLYTAANLGDLPHEEAFIAGDPDAEKETLETLKAQRESLDARISDLQAKVSKSKASKEEEAPKKASEPEKAEEPAKESAKEESAKESKK